MAKTPIHKTVTVKHNPNELAELEWLAKETKRTNSGAIKWAVSEKAKELGYGQKKGRG